MAEDPQHLASTTAGTNQPPKKDKKKPENLVIPEPKPKLSKKERRELQEQQRAAKAGTSAGGGGRGATPASSGGGASGSERASTATRHPSDTTKVTAKAAPVKPSIEAKKDTKGLVESAASPPPLLSSSSISIVSHLTPYQNIAQSKVFTTGATLDLTQTSHHHHLHPAVVQLGFDYANGTIRGGNARCRAMLDCFARVLRDYLPPSLTQVTTSANHPGRGSSVDLRQAVDQQVLKPSFAFWYKCRPHSVSMGNAFTFVKAAVASLDRDLSYDSMRDQLLETLQAYQQERIDLAGQAIVDLVLKQSSHHAHSSLLSENDVVLVYGHSEVVSLLLQQAAASETPRPARVIVVDALPLSEGRRTLEQLRHAGLSCSYILLNALTYVLQDVTKVLLGASALMSDGSVLGRAGMASVALLAQAHHVPVLVCAETYKISNRVQLESITTNELGDPQQLPGGADPDGNEPENLKRLHLMYDLTPASFVSGIVTELGIVPPTSVAVLLREMNPHDIKTSQ